MTNLAQLKVLVDAGMPPIIAVHGAAMDLRRFVDRVHQIVSSDDLAAEIFPNDAAVNAFLAKQVQIYNQYKAELQAKVQALP